MKGSGRREYPLIHPSFSQPKGKTARLIAELLKQRDNGSNEGGNEILAVLREITRDEDLYQLNFLLTERSAPHLLAKEFLAFLTSSVPKKNPFYERHQQRFGGKEIPLHAIPMSNATTALTACLMAQHVEGGEVITTSLNFPGIPNAIIMAGAKPRFVDINPDNFCMSADSLAVALGEKTRAIVLVHVNQYVDLEPFVRLLEERNLDIPLIQDASLAIGSTSKGVHAGVINFGPRGATVFSFATSKILSGCGGGMVVTHDAALAQALYAMSYQGRDFSHLTDLSSFGGNFKMNDINAAIVREQLKQREEFFAKRRSLKETYDRELKPLISSGKISVQKIDQEGVVTHYMLLIPDRNQVAIRLYRDSDVHVHIGMWLTHHLQKIYQQRFGYRAGMLPVTEGIADRIAYLPFHTELNDRDVRMICTTLADVLG